ncbi:hypothetical protein BGZ73_003414 [Actinomortierella ambigua]|nr:hypothetical protein BGZ73_003414 [Actinomortierella ambigua]
MSSPRLRVIIVGGGIGGLSLANMLERTNIEYVVLERSTTIKALGSSLGLDASSLPVMEQLGLLDDFFEAGKPVRQFNFYDDRQKKLGKVDFSAMTEIGGYPAVILDRPSFYSILLKKLPRDKIFLGKRVLSIIQEEDKARVQCADGTSYEGDIVIGADGAYSAVRQNIYKELKAKNLLSASDAEPLSYDQHCLVGVSEPLDPSFHHSLRDMTCDFEIVLSRKEPFYTIYMPLPNNRISWAVLREVEGAESKSKENFKVSEWGPEAVQEMINYVRHQPSIYNGTLGDIIDKTPREFISKVMLEEKSFDSWYHGRAVLLGDACHKIVPSSGLGANLAILEGVCLANLLVDMQGNSQAEITKVFETYYQRRHPIAKAALKNARQFGKIMSSHGWVADVVRKVFLNYIPDRITRWSNAQRLQHRPQLHYLPQVPDRGSVKGLPQDPRLYHGSQVQKKASAI